jgi:hypothetical protein
VLLKNDDSNMADKILTLVVSTYPAILNTNKKDGWFSLILTPVMDIDYDTAENTLTNWRSSS